MGKYFNKDNAVKATETGIAYKFISPVATSGVLDLLGVKTFTHGTSHQSAEKILKEGLNPALGGNPSGAGRSIGSDYYARHSVGKVHVAVGRNKKLIAKAHANLVQAAQKGPLSQKKAIRAFNTGILYNKGKVLHGVVSKSDFVSKFKPDPDLRGGGFTTDTLISAVHLGNRPSIKKIIKYRDSFKNISNIDKLKGIGKLLGAVALSAGAFHLIKKEKKQQY